MAGITVTEKGTQNFAQADARGDFRIQIRGAQATLVFSAINVTTKEVPVTAGQNVNITLAEKTTELNDVVVIGYATQRRRDLTGAVSSVNAGQIKDIPLSSAMQALQGRLAGVNISTTEGGPGAAVTIKVRGGGSITQDNTPLYVVDGIQVEDALSKIAPQDIESVDVLKDAAATSIYGARGANGVVIITTKGGKPHENSGGLQLFLRRQQAGQKFDVMDPQEFIEYNWEKTRNTLSDSSRVHFSIWQYLGGAGFDQERGCHRLAGPYVRQNCTHPDPQRQHYRRR